MTAEFDGSGICAVRRHGASNVEARYTGGEQNRLFLVTHVPDLPTGAGILLCPSIFVDTIRNYRRELALANALADRGFTVQRFHYRGMGQSGGEIGDLTFDSMCADAREAGVFMTERAELSRVGFFGLRFGALVAASVATAGAPLALWQPAVSGSAYFRDAVRAQRVTEIKHKINNTSGSDLRSELQETGRAVLLGYSLGRPLFESAEAVTLRGATRDPGPLLMTVIGRPHPDYEQIVSDWREASVDVSEQRVDGADAWWFLDDRATIPDGLIEGTTEWCVSHFAKERA